METKKQQELVQFQKNDIARFTMFNIIPTGPEIAWVNVKHNVNLYFNCNYIQNLLMNFLGLNPENYSQYIKKQANQKNIVVEHHGAISDDKVLQTLPQRKSRNATFIDNNNDVYKLMEIGVNIDIKNSNYVDDSNNLEIKFGKIGSSNIRAVVNVHFYNGTQDNVHNATQQLDNLIAAISQKKMIKNEISTALAMSFWNFDNYGYHISDKSSSHYQKVFKSYSTKDEINVRCYFVITALQDSPAISRKNFIDLMVKKTKSFHFSEETEAKNFVGNCLWNEDNNNPKKIFILELSLAQQKLVELLNKQEFGEIYNSIKVNSIIRTYTYTPNNFTNYDLSNTEEKEFWIEKRL